MAEVARERARRAAARAGSRQLPADRGPRAWRK